MMSNGILCTKISLNYIICVSPIDIRHLLVFVESVITFFISPVNNESKIFAWGILNETLFFITLMNIWNDSECFFITSAELTFLMTLKFPILLRIWKNEANSNHAFFPKRMKENLLWLGALQVIKDSVCVQENCFVCFQTIDV